MNVRVTDKSLLAASGAISDAVRDAEESLGDTGRVLVRASGTEPLVRVMAEAESQDAAQSVVDRLSQPSCPRS